MTTPTKHTPEPWTIAAARAALAKAKGGAA